jgi:NADH:ubiquinone oxidoreductase subunit C
MSEIDQIMAYSADELENLFGVSTFTDVFVNAERAEINTYRSAALESMAFTKLHVPFLTVFPVDIVVLDSLENHDVRFTVIYVFRNLSTGSVTSLITKTAETLPLASSQSLFPAFNWAEREIWDFFGVFFINHPDLRRILTDYGFSGYPLRKDFPLSGYQEVHFDDPMKAIEYKVVELSQAFRTFRHTRTWPQQTEKLHDNNESSQTG